MEDTYRTIDNNIGEGYYTEKRSKFLAFAHHIESADEAMEIVKQYRKKYYDARHCCYAYMVGPERNEFRANDDGEPSSTAGKPILGQINSNELTDILIVAYRTAAADAISHCKIEDRIVEEKIEYKFTYPMMNSVMHVIKSMPAKIVAQHFDNNCSITISIRKSMAEELLSRLSKIY